MWYDKPLISADELVRGPGEVGVIHNLWITLWITMLIACKIEFCVRGL
jgi:hypothetical protein